MTKKVIEVEVNLTVERKPFQIPPNLAGLLIVVLVVAAVLVYASTQSGSNLTPVELTAIVAPFLTGESRIELTPLPTLSTRNLLTASDISYVNLSNGNTGVEATLTNNSGQPMYLAETPPFDNLISMCQSGQIDKGQSMKIYCGLWSGVDVNQFRLKIYSGADKWYFYPVTGRVEDVTDQ